MKHENDNEWLDSMLESQIHHKPEQFDFQKWADNHPEEARLLRCGFEKSCRSTKTKLFEIWRFIMESKVTRYSAAAVVALAAVLVLFGPFGTSKNGGVVLADVQKKVAGIETMIIRGTKTYTHPDKDGEIFEFDGIKCQFDIVRYQSTQYGVVEEGYAEGKLIYRVTFNIPENQTLILFPKYKKYLKFASMDALAKVMEIFTTPNGILDLLIAGGAKKLGRDKIDGIEVEAFEFEDTEHFEPIKELLPRTVFNIQSFKGKLWIGIKEQLPVQVEGDLAIGKTFTTMFQELNLHEINTFGDYNIDLDEGIFDTTIPEGYTEITLSDILPFIPLKVKAGITGLGLGFFIIPAGFIARKKRRRKKEATNPR